MHSEGQGLCCISSCETGLLSPINHMEWEKTAKVKMLGEMYMEGKQ